MIFNDFGTTLERLGNNFALNLVQTLECILDKFGMTFGRHWNQFWMPLVDFQSLWDDFWIALG